MKYSTDEAAEKIDELIELALAGQEVIICVDGHSAVQLLPIENTKVENLRTDSND